MTKYLYELLPSIADANIICKNDKIIKYNTFLLPDINKLLIINPTVFTRFENKVIRQVILGLSGFEAIIVPTYYCDFIAIGELLENKYMISLGKTGLLYNHETIKFKCECPLVNMFNITCDVTIIYNDGVFSIHNEVFELFKDFDHTRTTLGNKTYHDFSQFGNELKDYFKELYKGNITIDCNDEKYTKVTSTFILKTN